MVLEILTHSGQVRDHGDAHRPQMLGGPDAGEHEELRGVDAAAAQEHLPGGVGPG
jgi:hypothetical protein